MITKEQLKQTIELVFLLKGELTIPYLPLSIIETVKGCYNLYYGGYKKMEIYPEYYRDGSCNLSAYKELGGIDAVIDRIYQNIQDDISTYVMTALNNIGCEDTVVKYFGEKPELYERFKNEVYKLKNKTNE
jgi:hypothetical protein